MPAWRRVLCALAGVALLYPAWLMLQVWLGGGKNLMVFGAVFTSSIALLLLGSAATGK